jgi:hypothetical protein
MDNENYIYVIPLFFGFGADIPGFNFGDPFVVVFGDGTEVLAKRTRRGKQYYGLELNDTDKTGGRKYLTFVARSGKLYGGKWLKGFTFDTDAVRAYPLGYSDHNKTVWERNRLQKAIAANYKLDTGKEAL